ncbi:MAG TPA: SDR family NAD(P)-dependent oxidoreductase [Caulobacteraceae bacterium]|nr:SDR family NAD(P)-dependent oxidoreductase [Caulobacteraceae bacterium]
MKDFNGKIAVITGGGTGMGRELARQLTAEGCNVAMCDVSADTMAATKALCAADAPQGTKVAGFVADVGDEAQVGRFRDEIARAFDTDRIHLLFNNAGIGGGGSFVAGERAEWERTFNVCWGGVYACTRVFLPMLVAASEAHIVNTSSVNGFWGSLGPGIPHTAYVAAKFAVKGFSEALMTDLAVNAPHVKCSVVMPGHIGTEIVSNSRKVLTGDASDSLSPRQIALTRARLRAMGMEIDAVSDAEINAMAAEQARRFRDEAPTTAARAATVILDGVRTDRWRILVGHDAEVIDTLVRADPEHAYEPGFFAHMATEAGWRLGQS